MGIKLLEMNNSALHLLSFIEHTDSIDSVSGGIST